MKKIIQELKSYIYANRIASTILCSVLFLIILASFYTIHTSRNNNGRAAIISPSPVVTRKRMPRQETISDPSATPTLTKKEAGEYSIGIKLTNIPTPSATATLPPTPTLTPTQTPTPSPTLTPTPLPPDTTPPSFMEITGPGDGTTVAFNGFCFPMRPVDNRSTYPQIKVRHNFDNAGWTDWNIDVAPCFTNVENGGHTFSAQAQDEAGNLSEVITRTFTVSVE